jgi:hypothetical protein
MRMVFAHRRKTLATCTAPPLVAILILSITGKGLATSAYAGTGPPGALFHQLPAATAALDRTIPLADHALVVGSNDPELVLDTSLRMAGMRFTGVSVSHGATFVKAYPQFQVDETDSDTAALTIHGQAYGNAPTFASTNGNISCRAGRAAMHWRSSLSAWADGWPNPSTETKQARPCCTWNMMPGIECQMDHQEKRCS